MIEVRDLADKRMTPRDIYTEMNVFLAKAEEVNTTKKTNLDRQVARLRGSNSSSKSLTQHPFRRSVRRCQITSKPPLRDPNFWPSVAHWRLALVAKMRRRTLLLILNLRKKLKRKAKVKKVLHCQRRKPKSLPSASCFSYLLMASTG